MTPATKIIAVTGGTGFIGTSVLKQLLQRGFKINALTRKARANTTDDSEQLSWITGDLNDTAALATLATGVDTFIHIAGLTKARSLKALLDANETGAANAANAARSAGARRFILVSSIAAREPALSHYANSKRAGEEVVRKSVGDMELIIVRPPAIIGPGDEATKPMLDILRRGYLPAPSGKAGRDGRMSFVYMEDIARFLIEQIDAPTANIVITPHGGTPQTSWRELADSAAIVLSKPVRVVSIAPIVLKIAASLTQTVSALFRQSGFFNGGKVRELLHTDWTGDTPIAGAKDLNEALGLAFGMDIDV